MAVDFNPMNLQLMVPKSTDVSQLQQNMHHQVNALQDNQLAKQKETDEVNQRTVRRPEEADSPAKIARCKEMLAHLLDKVDTLCF